MHQVSPGASLPEACNWAAQELEGLNCAYLIGERMKALRLEIRRLKADQPARLYHLIAAEELFHQLVDRLTDIVRLEKITLTYH